MNPIQKIFLITIVAFLIGVVLLCQMAKTLNSIEYLKTKATEASQIEKRALETEIKDCYSWQEIEIIIHGEIQE